MLDVYKDKQSIMYNLLMNEISNNKISHAYLIDENNNSESFNIVMAFIKEVLSYGMNNIEKEILFKRIDDNNYPEIKIIEPDGMLIKKKQLLNLQQEFSMVAVEGSKRIYVIRDADAMRGEAANSMLKFLEEPNNNIMAILMTNNFNAILPTIISRCQIIRLNKDDVIKENNEACQIVLDFIKSIEEYGVRTIINEQKLIFDKISVKDREKFVDFFDKMIDMYYDIMKINLNNFNIKFFDYMEDFKFIAKKNSKDLLLKKINYLVLAKEMIKNNVNMNLFLDNVIINIGGMQ